MTHTLTALMGGTRSQHPLHFTVDRPRGLGSFLLLRFYVPVVVQTNSGRASALPGDCLLYDPRFPQWYRGHETGLCDDWLHFEGPRAEAFITACGLPLNHVFRVHEHQFVPRLIDDVNQELTFRDPFSAEMIDLRLRELLMRLGRGRQSAAEPRQSPANARHLAQLRQIRMQVQREFTRPWTIGEMARLGKLSPSRFFALYRGFFGISPIEDLIRVRLASAKMLLSSASVSVKETAECCGFRNVYYFSRLFHRRVGCAPRDYRRWHDGRL